NWAPTHKKTEPWRFKVFMGDSKVELGKFLVKKYQETAVSPKAFKVKKLGENTSRSAAVIAICMQRDLTESLPEWEEIAATAMAVQNMWLCCTEMEIGCYWSSPGLIKYMGEFIELGGGEQCLGFLFMGRYEEEISVGERKPIEDKVVWFN
ncbi:MAG: nitroreductase family protein, partial [Eudoraea sp.]|uniref:nitroreductase family protein n=1 Tax=Eudoraea sp. TaxID=1979955 RepID=UPI003C74154C